MKRLALEAAVRHYREKNLSSGYIISDTIYIDIKTVVLVFDNLEGCILNKITYARCPPKVR